MVVRVIVFLVPAGCIHGEEGEEAGLLHEEKTIAGVLERGLSALLWPDGDDSHVQSPMLWATKAEKSPPFDRAASLPRIYFR